MLIVFHCIIISCTNFCTLLPQHRRVGEAVSGNGQLKTFHKIFMPLWFCLLIIQSNLFKCNFSKINNALHRVANRCLAKETENFTSINKYTNKKNIKLIILITILKQLHLVLDFKNPKLLASEDRFLHTSRM